ncbi:hypothetical protein WBG83_13735 [Paenibacillus sp. y28]
MLDIGAGLLLTPQAAISSENEHDSLTQRKRAFAMQLEAMHRRHAPAAIARLKMQQRHASDVL